MPRGSTLGVLGHNGAGKTSLIRMLTAAMRPDRGRVYDLVERFDLHAIASRRVGELSGGSRRRVDLAASPVASPTVPFLDEPSTGLDPGARQGVWEVIIELTAAGTTVVLTTQHLEEADRLADRLVVLDHGRVVARCTPGESPSTSHRSNCNPNSNRARRDLPQRVKEPPQTRLPRPAFLAITMTA